MKHLPSPTWRVFLVVVVLGLTWAEVTSQEWEEFYITYRAPSNLAEGAGLVFSEGQRVHSFTSPLGVLLPAASYLLTGRTPDVAALWLFRRMGLAAVAGDRGLQQFDLDLPAAGGRIELTFKAGPHGSNAYDWSYWYDLRFGSPP